MDVPLAYRQKDILRRVIKERCLGPRYVELGCGDAFTMELFAELGMAGIGVDYAPVALEAAKAKRLPGASYLEADFLKLDLKREPFVLLLNVLEHFKDDASILKLMNRYLKVGGYLGLAMPAHSKAYGPGDKLAGHWRRYDREELTKKLEFAGFEVTDFYSIGYPVGNLYTGLYNLWLRMLKKDYEFKPENTPETGLKDSVKHLPGPIQAVAGFAFPILRKLIKLDRPFQRTDFGNNYLVMARKVRELAENGAKAPTGKTEP